MPVPLLLARDGEPIFTGAYGLADRERDVPNALQTQFRNGSMNKMFTATAVLTLAQAGKLSLDDPMGKYLTDYPNEYQYSNYGFVLLGAIIESTSGQSYYDYVREHVYAPAGMTSTASLPEDESVPNRSVGYMRSPEGGAVPNTETLPYRGMAAGGGYTTVEDLLRFADALTNHRLLNAEYTTLLTAGKVDAGAERYAYGFGERISDGIRSVGHSGGAPGMNGDLLIFDSGYVIAVLANMDPPAATRISQFIAARLPASIAAP